MNFGSVRNRTETFVLYFGYGETGVFDGLKAAEQTYTNSQQNLYKAC
jgi:hypothetical protein